MRSSIPKRHSATDMNLEASRSKLHLCEMVWGGGFQSFRSGSCQKLYPGGDLGYLVVPE